MPITALPAELISLILTQLSFARNIKGVKRVCRAFRDAAGPAVQSLRLVCFEGHTHDVASAPSTHSTSSISASHWFSSVCTARISKPGAFAGRSEQYGLAAAGAARRRATAMRIAHRVNCEAGFC